MSSQGVSSVMPAKAGIQGSLLKNTWIPAYAGMTGKQCKKAQIFNYLGFDLVPYINSKSQIPNPQSHHSNTPIK
jgi:hypothetical protein